MGGPKSLHPADLALGGTIQCLEAASLGMPFEVWKTHMARNRDFGAAASFKHLYGTGGAKIFWKGTSAKMVESFTKGAILLASKTAIMNSCEAAGMGPVVCGVLGGAGGGVCQVSVMGPCTFLVTASVTGSGSHGGVLGIAKHTLATKGLKGFYPGGTAIAFRQATNWASRQGFTDAVREQMKVIRHGDSGAKLSMGEEAISGMIGGAMACWNHPFEVARVEAQSIAAQGGSPPGMLSVMGSVVEKQGFRGLFAGLTPRLGLGIWQTLFMVTGARIIKEKLDM